MKIAVASQNRREITGHTGRCRKFWIYQIEQDAIAGKELLELTKEQSFHETSGWEPSQLDDVEVLIAGGLARRLQKKHPGLGHERNRSGSSRQAFFARNVADRAVRTA